MRLHRATLILPMLALLAAPALAADSTTKAFKKAAKGRLKELNEAIQVALQPLKPALALAAAAYAKDETTADGAVAQAAATIVIARDAIQDAAFDAAMELQVDGQQALLQGGVTEPGADFQAGAQGTWDDALGNFGQALDKADKKLNKRWAKFTKNMVKAASAGQVALDLRSSLPPHGTAWQGVAPPAALPAEGPIPGAPLVPPEVLVVARLVESNTPDTLVIGLRAATRSVDVNVASTDADEATLGPLAPDVNGTASGSFALDTLAHPQGFVVVTLDDGTLTSSSVAVSAPTLSAPDASSEATLKEYKQDLNAGRKALLEATSAAVKEFNKSLSTQLADTKAGRTAPDAALTSGFDSLATAREAIGLAWLDFLENTSTKTSSTFSEAGVDDANIPGDFQPDFDGVAGSSLATTLQKLGKKQAQLGKSFRSFTSKVVKASQTGDTPIAAGVATSHGSGFSAPMVTGASTPPLLPTTSTDLVDGLMVVTGTGGTPAFMLNVQADPLAVPSMSISSTSLPDATVGDLGDMAPGAGGTQTQELPLTVDDSITGFTFNGGPTETNQSSPMVLSIPTVPPPTP